ncbi:hypothetical protein [Prosthecobacter vanneervenii]|uniref:Uncharacterized protein n=1 Tax=Prosthecobacter vanneervenii TaxID=48466 RepID=A0A7W7YA13_9BACT|nr:hypothetical protein [Prosthecobacter vanneervenii]MBB5032383.1 hypothetical protein [Prosthecobacter vanneervenii]
MTTPKERKRGVVDTLVTRDHTAIFWFLAACVVAACCAGYVVLMSEALRQRPPFVVMDTAGAYYVPPGELYPQMKPMHLQLCDVLAETLLERKPEGLVYEGRLKQLCWVNEKHESPGREQIDKEVQKEQKYFQTQKVTQVAAVEKTVIAQANNTRVGTITTGIVRRRSFFSGKEKEETYRFTLKVIWHQNAKMMSNKGFPSQVETLVKLSMEPISES